MKRADFFAASSATEAGVKLRRSGGSGFETNDDDLSATAPRAYACAHRRLSGEMRCHGCGRSRNEIELER
jgi:hypothetical protein